MLTNIIIAVTASTACQLTGTDKKIQFLIKNGYVVRLKPQPGYNEPRL